ncbi:MAG: NAD(P)H-hydrate epimerase [Planctomycetota bacterium]|jgi:NAD(P)H-hydrate epimerase
MPRPAISATRPTDGGPPHGTLIFDRAAIQAVDRDAIEQFAIPGIVLMENASIGLAREAEDMTRTGATVLICCGRGNNGGDGYALARHLHNRGRHAVLAATGEPRDGTDAAVNREICRRMGLPLLDAGQCGEVAADLVVDALFGTGLDRPVTGAAAGVVDWMNAEGTPVLAVDVPSGLDCDTGAALGRAVVATRTVTFVGWKRGFLAPHARKHLGEIVVVDIGAPAELYERHGTRTS